MITGIVLCGDSEGDWYTIEQNSGRISDADVEGDGSEMIAIARAVLADGQESFKRCAVAVDVAKGIALFHSPRNSQRQGEVELAAAKRWATETLKQLKAEVTP